MFWAPGPTPRCTCSSASCRATRRCCCAATVCTGRCLTKRCGSILASNQELPALAQSLISTALEHGSRDNITALVVRCSGNQE